MDAQVLDEKAFIAFLEKKLDEKRAAITELKKQMADLEDVITKTRRGLGIGPSQTVLPLGVQPPSAPSTTHTDMPEISPRAFRMMRLQAAVLRCLELAGRLQGTRAITHMLRAGGFQFQATDVPKAVSQTLVRLWRDGKVTRTTENYWGLEQWGAVPNPMPRNGNVAA
jgi:hypothetical protein